jgi:hypothetical protein
MKTIITLFLLLIGLGLSAQVVVAPTTKTESKITLVDDGGDTWHTIDTTVVYSTAFTISTGVAADSSVIVPLLVADTVAATRFYLAELASYTRNVNARLALDVKITTDSLEYVYWAERIAELSIAIDTIQAN